MDSYGLVTIGIGIIILGAASGIAFIGYATMSNMARQPAKSAEMRIVMIVLVALLEGISLFALVICLLIVLGIKAV
ncbi:MAG: ATP synthase F0 subunit C [Spirochaetota bacterium]|nr:ATP synthase F0 subunit C [Spirochaetota bacterium]